MYAADRMKNIPFSAIRKVFEEVHRREALGENIVNLGIGRPDFDTPGNIKEAAKKALDDGMVHYASNYGVDELRVAIADKFKRDNGLVFDADKEVMVSVGANEAVFLSMMAFINPGDEVLLPDPFWPHYPPCIELAGGTPVSVPIFEENGFNPTADDLKAAITDKTKMIVVTTPHNPTGGVLSADCLKVIAEIAIANDLLVLSDEIYEHLIYGDEKHVSIASLPGMRERTITVNGFSKSYSMTGWRLGFVGIDESLMSPMIRAHQYSTVCVTTFAQYGAVEALSGPQDATKAMAKEFGRRRDLVVSKLSEVDLISFSQPKGAFYVMVNVSKTGLSASQVAAELLDFGVAVVPWDEIGNFSQGFIRLSYANSYENLEVGMERMTRYFATKTT